MRILKRALHATLAIALATGMCSLVALRFLTAREVGKARANYEVARESLRQAEADHASRAARLRELTSSTRAVEVEIRTQYRMVKPGERLMLIERAPPTPSGTP